jgi:hypothetical protein
MGKQWREPTPRMLEVIRAMEAHRPMLDRLETLDGGAYDRLDEEYQRLTEPLHAAWREEWKGERSIPLIPRSWPPSEND